MADSPAPGSNWTTISVMVRDDQVDQLLDTITSAVPDSLPMTSAPITEGSWSYTYQINLEHAINSVDEEANPGLRADLHSLLNLFLSSDSGARTQGQIDMVHKGDGPVLPLIALSSLLKDALRDDQGRYVSDIGTLGIDPTELEATPLITTQLSSHPSNRVYQMHDKIWSKLHQEAEMKRSRDRHPSSQRKW